MTQSNRETHETQLIRAFILPQRQSRYLELLPNPRRRKDVTRELAHFKHIDPRRIVPQPTNKMHTADILETLRTKGALEKCFAISEDDDLDGKELLLSEALKAIVGRGIGTFLSCIPGRLAYFEDEDGRFILELKK
jgi:hypothetical protein